MQVRRGIRGADERGDRAGGNAGSAVGAGERGTCSGCGICGVKTAVSSRRRSGRRAMGPGVLPHAHRPVIRRTSKHYGWHRGDMLIRLYDGNREALRPLFRLADDSEQEINQYAGLGNVLVAENNGELVGQLQLVPTAESSTFELKSMAVVDGRRGGGIGRALVAEAVAFCRARGATRLLVATAAADIDNLRFYQRRGFRMLRIERDAFTAASGYADGIDIDGIPLRDRVWLDQYLAP